MRFVDVPATPGGSCGGSCRRFVRGFFLLQVSRQLVDCRKLLAAANVATASSGRSGRDDTKTMEH